MSLVLSPSAVIWAGDYYPDYLKQRGYIDKKIQHGFSIDAFVKLGDRTEDLVNKRNQIKDMVSNSYQASPISANRISTNLNQKFQSARYIRESILQHSKSSTKGHTTYTDGKTVFYHPHTHLPTKITGARLVDEYGNVIIKDTYNIQHNHKRLLTSSDARLTDILGSVDLQHWEGEYTPDSVFYGDPERNTNAVKNLAEYSLEGIDSAGNIKTTIWKASKYNSHLLESFSQINEDSIYGETSFERHDITYNDNNYKQVSSFSETGKDTHGFSYYSSLINTGFNKKDQVVSSHEEKTTTLKDGGKVTTITDSEFRYLPTPDQFGPDVEEPDPDRLSGLTTTTITENWDGSERTEKSTINYVYNKDFELIDAYATSVFSGREPGWYKYTDSQGHILSRNKNEAGNIIYTYVNPETLEHITIPIKEVIITLEAGNEFYGSSKTQFEILFNMPMASQVYSITYYYHPQTKDLLRTEESTLTYNNGIVNNLRRRLNSHEHKENIDCRHIDEEGNPQKAISDIRTSYIYAENGNLVDAFGTGFGSGYEFTTADGWIEYYTEIEIQYGIYLGRPEQDEYKENKYLQTITK